MKYKNMALGMIGSVKGTVLVSNGKITRKIKASASSNNVRRNKREMLNNMALDAVAQFQHLTSNAPIGSDSLKNLIRSRRIKYQVLNYHFSYTDTSKFYTVKRVKIKNKYYVQVRDKKTGKLKDTKKYKRTIEELEI